MTKALRFLCGDGKRPDTRNIPLPHARLLARVELPGGKSSRTELGQAMVLIPGELEAWLDKVLPSTLDRSRMERKEQVELPFEMIREAVVNALIHRDYDMIGQKCQLVVNSDVIMIKSPGRPTPPITLEQMRSFSAPTKSRNPILHHVFSRMGMAEEQGYGLASLRKHAENLGLPLPSYSMEDDSLALTIYRTIDGASSSLAPSTLAALNKPQIAGWQWLATKESCTVGEYAEARGLAKRTAGTHLKKFKELGLVVQEGSGPSTTYRVIRS